MTDPNPLSPAAQAVLDAGLLPMIVSETGAAGEPEQERIICSAISGGADYANNMPRELFLERVKVGIAGRKSIFARYIQASLEVAQASPLAPLQPVPISERLPGPEDCAFNVGATVGSCWCWNPPSCDGSTGWWSFEPLEYAEDATHWLPAHALPLPTTTTEPTDD